jgi:hypothetical protein
MGRIHYNRLIGWFVMMATTHDTTHPIAATIATAASTRPPDPPLYTLPTGEIINAKNINQCYDAMAQRNDNYNGNNNNNNNNSVTPPTNLGIENVITSNSNNPSNTAVPLRVTTNNTKQDHGSGSNNDNNNVPTVHAFAVESQIVVDAEPISVLLQPQPQPQPPLQPPPLQQQRSPVFYIASTLVIVSLVAAASLGVYCGTGNCKSNGGGTAMTSPNSNSGVLTTPMSPPTNPSSSLTGQPPTALTPTATTPTATTPTAPTTASTPTTAAAAAAAAAAIMVACDFLNISTVNGTCQATTRLSNGGRTDTTIPREIGMLTQLTSLS